MRTAAGLAPKGTMPPTWDKLAKTCDVAIEIDSEAGRIAVAGYRDAVVTFVARTKATNSSGSSKGTEAATSAKAALANKLQLSIIEVEARALLDYEATNQTELVTHPLFPSSALALDDAFVLAATGFQGG
jgi:hypothetical protein